MNFYTEVLGMRLVKKTVNQDDVSAYHLFYADGDAAPGTRPHLLRLPAAPETARQHTPSSRTGLRVAGGEPALVAGAAERPRCVDRRHRERDGRLTLDFEDPEGQRLALIDDGGKGEAHPWAKSPVPASTQIRGLGPITLRVPQLRRPMSS